MVHSLWNALTILSWFAFNPFERVFKPPIAREKERVQQIPERWTGLSFSISQKRNYV